MLGKLFHLACSSLLGYFIIFGYLEVLDSQSHVKLKYLDFNLLSSLCHYRKKRQMGWQPLDEQPGDTRVSEGATFGPKNH